MNACQQKPAAPDTEHTFIIPHSQKQNNKPHRFGLYKSGNKFHVFTF